MKRVLTLIVLTVLAVSFQNCGGLNSGEVEELEQGVFQSEDVAFSAKAASKKITLFKSISDRQRRYYYRIPSLVTVNRGNYLIAFAEQRVASNGDSGDINVVYRISSNNGDSWSRTYSVCELGRNTCGNPTAVVDQNTGVVHLFMNANPGNRKQYKKRSTDLTFRVGDRRTLYRQARVVNGRLSLGALQDLTGDGRRPSYLRSYINHRNFKTENRLYLAGAKMDMVGPGVGIQLSKGSLKGRLVVPAQRRSFISDDGGRSWRMSQNVMPALSSETSIMELDNGHIIRNDRATGANKCRRDAQKNLLPGSVRCRRALSLSTNKGNRFTRPSISNNLLDPISQGSMLRYSQGNLFMANCNSTKFRKYLTIKSTSNGQQWQTKKRIDSLCGYSSMAKLRSGAERLGIIYERKSSNHALNPVEKPLDIVFNKFSLSQLGH